MPVKKYKINDNDYDYLYVKGEMTK